MFLKGFSAGYLGLLQRRYRIDGGFKAWTAAGVRTKSEGVDSPIEILKEVRNLSKAQYLHFELSLRCRGAAFLLLSCHIICKIYPYLINIISLASISWWRSQYKDKADLFQDVVQLVLMVILVLQSFSMCCPYFPNFSCNF